MTAKFPKIIILSSLILLGSGIADIPAFMPTTQAQYIQLSADQMKAALQCPTDASKEFVDDCFTLVTRGILPESLVLSAFHYAMGKPKNRWVYFGKSLEVRCDGLGIDLHAEMKKLH
ncbi:MAG: hypothetical protein Q4C70_01695 [Planctomycetia bacterium]|nr:hypothetical protein [Planctomycetia bacterium]